MKEFEDNRILLLIQGPFHTNLAEGGTLDVLRSIQNLPSRNRFFVTYALWQEETEEVKRQIAALVDHAVTLCKPEEAGSCNRNFQAHGVFDGIEGVQDYGFRYCLKTRSDILLTSKFMETALAMASEGSEKLLVTNLYTHYEPFHISDMIVFSTMANIKAYFTPVPVHYEDLYSPEVQFARVFVRSQKLPYTMTLKDYFLFLRDWVELVDFNEMELQWLKIPKVSVRVWNKINWIFVDRDCGPLLTRLVTPKFHRFTQRTRLPLSLVAHLFIILDTIYRILCFHGKVFRWRSYNIHKEGPEYELTLPENSCKSGPE